MVKHRLNAVKQFGCAHVVLSGNLAEQQARVIEFGISDGMYHLFEQESQNAVTGQFDVHHLRSAVNLAPGQTCGATVSLTLALAYVIKQGALKSA